MPAAAERGHAVVNRPVQPALGAPEHFRSLRRRPLRDLVVVAHHIDGKRSGRGEHATGHLTCKRGSSRGVERGSQTHLRVAEALHGHQHGGAHRGESMVRAMPIRGAVGVLGRPGWAEVDERGGVRAADGSWRLDWWVGADRWRDPRAEVAVRHGARDGAPVFETALRVDGGDVRQRVYAAAEGGGLVMVEVENDSPAPVAVAFLLRGASAHTLISPRPPTVVAGPSGPGAPPAEASRFPLPHRGVLRVAVPFAGTSTTWPDRAPSAAQVVSGWHTLLGGAERIDAPGSWPDRHALARSQLLLVDDLEPAAMLIALGLRVRLGTASLARETAHQVGRAAQAIAARCRRGMSSRDGVALVDALDLLIAGGDPTAARDVAQLLDQTTFCDTESDLSDPADVVAIVRRMVVTHAHGGGRELLLLPSPAEEWQGENIAAHDVPTRFGRLSFAVRWHGTRPAVLWELDERDGAPVTLRARGLDPDWSTTQPKGEALLALSAT